MTRRRLLAPVAAMLAAAAVAAHAAPPPPLDTSVFAFPGSFSAPASATSAGLALADRWLGAEPAANPAAAPPRGVTVAPLALRTSRQDLSAANREFDQQVGYVDFAAARVTLPLGATSVSLYAWQPLLRLENSSYTAGAIGAPVSATVTHDGESRDLRAGLAVSRPFGALRAGVAAEWGQRKEHDVTTSKSGAPDSGTRDATFDGSSLGGAAGVTWDRGSEARGGWRVGAGVRYEASLDVSGTASVNLLVADSTAAVSATRDALAEGGVSVAYTLTAESHLCATLGVRSGETWSEFGIESRAGTLWSLGADFHDAETPWSARLGVGQETRPGTRESRAGLVGAGIGWTSGETTFELGLLHRTVQRPGSPNLSDDRLVGSVAVHF